MARILIVDDAANLRLLYRMELQKCFDAGYFHLTFFEFVVNYEHHDPACAR